MEDSSSSVVVVVVVVIVVVIVVGSYSVCVRWRGGREKLDWIS